MLKVRDLSVARRLQFLLVVMVFGTLAVVAIGDWARSKIEATLVEAGRVEVPALRNHSVSEVAFERLRAAVEQAVIARTQDDDDAVADALQAATSAATKHDEALQGLVALEIGKDTRAA